MSTDLSESRLARCRAIRGILADLHEQMDQSMPATARSMVVRKIGMQDRIDLDETPIAAGPLIYYALYGYQLGGQTVAEQFAEDWLASNAHEGPVFDYLRGVQAGVTISMYDILDRDDGLGPMEARLRDLLTGDEYLVVDELLGEAGRRDEPVGKVSGNLVPLGDFFYAIGSLIPILKESRDRVFAWHAQRGNKRIDRKSRSELALLLARRNLLDLATARELHEEMEEN